MCVFYRMWVGVYILFPLNWNCPDKTMQVTSCKSLILLTMELYNTWDNSMNYNYLYILSMYHVWFVITTAEILSFRFWITTRIRLTTRCVGLKLHKGTERRCGKRGTEKKKWDILQTFHLYGLVILSIIIILPFP